MQLLSILTLFSITAVMSAAALPQSDVPPQGQAPMNPTVGDFFGGLGLMGLGAGVTLGVGKARGVLHDRAEKKAHDKDMHDLLKMSSHDRFLECIGALTKEHLEYLHSKGFALHISSTIRREFRRVCDPDGEEAWNAILARRTKMREAKRKEQKASRKDGSPPSGAGYRPPDIKAVIGRVQNAGERFVRDVGPRVGGAIRRVKGKIPRIR